MDYTQLASLPASEKEVLCIARARSQVKLFTAETPYLVNDIYSKQVAHFVSEVLVDGVLLEEGSDPEELVNGEFYFDITAKKLYVSMPDNSNPKTKNVVLTYKFFWALTPQILPYDLNSGEPVEFDGLIESIGSVGQQLDDENTGIVLESSSSISLQNVDGYFDEIFDTLIWEYQKIEFYSWSPRIPITEAKRLFEGIIESKEFSHSQITFQLKDFVFKLKNHVNLSSFSEADGNIAESMLGKPKRRIYGKCKQVETVGIDQVLDGFPLTGTIQITTDSTALVGTGTQFLSQLSPSDELFFETSDGETVKLSVESITDDTHLVLSDEADLSISGQTVRVKPKVPYRLKNRRWHIAGHPLVAPVAFIQFAHSNRRFQVDDHSDFFPGDIVDINGNEVAVLRKSGENIIVDQVIDPLPDVGNTIEKEPVTKVFFGSRELLIDRDWTLENFPDAVIVVDPLAEFNVAPTKTVGVNLTFTNGSRNVTTTATIDLRTILKQRDWIRKNHISETTWYEILDVKEQSITLRIAFVGTTQTVAAKMKNVDVIGDDALITVNCIGKRDENFKWIKTASDVVRDLILNDALFPSVEEDAFYQAKIDCPFIMSMVIPESVGDEAPLVREVITKVNESVFGSLYGNQSMAIAYSILNAEKPSNLTVIQDHDILSWTSTTEQKIVNKVKINYRPFKDIFTNLSAFETLEYDSAFVDEVIGIKNTDERTIYLYEEDKALTIAQRIAFFKSLSNCKVKLTGKLSLAGVVVNDKMYLEMDRLFKRYGGRDKKKIGIVTGVKKNGLEVTVELTDLGNIFNRIPVIAPNETLEYAAASRDDSVKYGFILDNDTLTPDNTSEVDLGNNRIG